MGIWLCAYVSVEKTLYITRRNKTAQWPDCSVLPSLLPCLPAAFPTPSLSFSSFFFTLLVHHFFLLCPYPFLSPMTKLPSSLASAISCSLCTHSPWWTTWGPWCFCGRTFRYVSTHRKVWSSTCMGVLQFGSYKDDNQILQRKSQHLLCEENRAQIGGVTMVTFNYSRRIQ